MDGSKTAFPHRTAQFAYNIPTTWDNFVDDDAMIEWTKRTAQALYTYAAGGSYPKVEPDTGSEVSRRGWDDNWQRLTAVKWQYDPTNFNIEPAIG